ncbi:helix-turn-helix transcriptional regulator [Caulobacter radicis]|uniref:helix-turn-helix transcriptional regulator n=1 Tax=Caulobacter radicis TaxID=2172650 RepID=UPI001402A079|nr:AraC family transcriptional regulator [Caulobacter radicis]
MITSIFMSAPLGGESQGEGWSAVGVQRDVAKIHQLRCGPFTCTLGGGNGEAGAFNTHLVFMRAGNLTIGQWGHRRTLSAGDIFVGCAWLPMTFDAVDEIELMVVELPAWWAMQRFLDRFLILPDLYVGRDFFAAEIIAQLARTVFELEDGDDAGAARGLEMIADLMRSALAACVDPDKAMLRASGRMGAILGFIARNLDQPGLSATDAAKSLKCSVRTIYKTCATYGTSFSAFLTEVRLVTAQHRLMRTDERVSQIAYGVGFSSLSHFSRLFRARFGVQAKSLRRIRSRVLH